MATPIKLIELSNGTLLSKPVWAGELLVNINKKNIFLEKREDELFWIIVLPDMECRKGWFNGSTTHNNAFHRRAEGRIASLSPALAALVTCSAAAEPEEFLPKIEQLGEEKIIAELEKLAVTLKH